MSKYGRLSQVDPNSLEGKLRGAISEQHKSDNTADVYWHWTEKFCRWLKKETGSWLHPKDANESYVEKFLTHLATRERVSANTQNQAFSALCYLYKTVIKRPLVNVKALRAKRPDNARNVIDQSEIIRLFDNLSGPSLLVACIMYGTSCRIGEAVSIRIKDISFERKQIVVRRGKGAKDRFVPFPEVLHDPVRKQIESARVLWRDDVRNGLNGVSLPDAYGRKASSAHLDFAWWYLFPSDNYSRCPHTGVMYRHHRDKDHIGAMIHKASIKAGIDKHITSHCLRHSYSTHFLEAGGQIRTLQKILGHANLETTEVYAHIAKDGITASVNPLQQIGAAVLTKSVKTVQPSPMVESLANPKPMRSVSVSMSRLRVG